MRLLWYFRGTWRLLLLLLMCNSVTLLTQASEHSPSTPAFLPSLLKNGAAARISSSQGSSKAFVIPRIQLFIHCFLFLRLFLLMTQSPCSSFGQTGRWTVLPRALHKDPYEEFARIKCCSSVEPTCANATMLWPAPLDWGPWPVNCELSFSPNTDLLVGPNIITLLHEPNGPWKELLLRGKNLWTTR